MSLLGPRRRTAVCLLLAGLTGLCGCDVLTDAPLTDSEMSAFLAEADSHATRSRGRAFQATAVAAADQRSAITEALSLSRVRSDAAAEAATLATRVGAVASDLSQAESTGLEVARSALDQAMQGEDPGLGSRDQRSTRRCRARTSRRSRRRSPTSVTPWLRPSPRSRPGAPQPARTRWLRPGRRARQEALAGEGRASPQGRTGRGRGSPSLPLRSAPRPIASHRAPQDSAEPAQGPPS